MDLKKKKINIYYGGFSFITGGVNAHSKKLKKQLEILNYDVRLITLDSLPFFLKYLPHIYEKLINFFIFPLGFYYKGILTKYLYKIFYDRNVDVNIFEDIYLSWNSKISSITLLHAVWSDNLQAYKTKKKQILPLIKKEANLINLTNHNVITVSNPYRLFLQNYHFKNLINKKIHVVELGLNLELFNRKKNRIKKSIIYVGALEKRKNIEFLIKVFKKIYLKNNNFTFNIIGDGPQYKEILKKVKNQNLPVKFFGRLNSKQVIENLLENEIYLHTSIKESFSYSLLEAKLSGLITLAYSNLEVPDEFIDIPLEVFDEDLWANKILNLENNKKKNFLNSKYSIVESTNRLIKLIK